MGFREVWRDPKSGAEIEKGLYESKPAWYKAFSHRVSLLCDLHRRTDGNRHRKVAAMEWPRQEPLTKAEILAWLRENAPTWEMRVDSEGPLDKREFACVPACQHPARVGEWKPLRDLTEDDL